MLRCGARRRSRSLAECRREDSGLRYRPAVLATRRFAGPRGPSESAPRLLTRDTTNLGESRPPANRAAARNSAGPPGRIPLPTRPPRHAPFYLRLIIGRAIPTRHGPAARRSHRAPVPPSAVTMKLFGQKGLRNDTGAHAPCARTSWPAQAICWTRAIAPVAAASTASRGARLLRRAAIRPSLRDQAVKRTLTTSTRLRSRL